MNTYEIQNGIIEAPLGVDRIRKIYNFASYFYALVNIIERKHHKRALELANIRSYSKVLEVAVGPGYTFLEILKIIERTNIVYGIDLSPRMLDKTWKLVTKKGFTNFNLKIGDARHLSFPDNTFDILYNSYMLDLIPLSDFSVILKEFRRVLKKGGRLVLVNFSKKDSAPVFTEKLYGLNPSLLLGCRPVLMESFVKEAGFEGIKREVPKFVLSLSTEIVTAQK